MQVASYKILQMQAELWQLLDGPLAEDMCAFFPSSTSIPFPSQ
jgi:hypothetical protein